MKAKASIAIRHEPGRAMPLALSLGMMALLCGAVAGAGASDQAPGPVSMSSEQMTGQQPMAVVNYWTLERMQAAKPLDVPKVLDLGLTRMSVTVKPTTDPPALSPGWDPNSGLEPPAPGTVIRLDPSEPNGFHAAAASFGLTNSSVAPQTFGSPPANPTDYPNYGKFARWTWYGNYLTYPTSTIGKLFFTKPGVGDFVCSATVVNRSTIVTAGHCVSSIIGGTPTFHTNFLFCPSYYKGSGSGEPYPTRGCWAWSQAATSSSWYNSGNVDRDYACIVTATTGTVVNDKVGNVTGWVGTAWNWPAEQSILSFGYAAAPPFPGYNIIAVAATEWYSINMSSAGETEDVQSKYIGSDLTGGSSGGPWWLGTRHPNPALQYADTDGVIYTGWVNGPFLNGVNSHKRCIVDCSSPPSSTQGIFWQEMGSPPFFSSSTDSQDTFDVIGVCTSHPNNNP